VGGGPPPYTVDVGHADEDTVTAAPGNPGIPPAAVPGSHGGAAGGAGCSQHAAPATQKSHSLSFYGEAPRDSLKLSENKR